MKTLLLAAVILLSGCAAQTMDSRQYPKRSTRGTPRYGCGDTVRQKRSGILFVIDSLQPRPNSSQIFYAAHYMNGIKANWLPENIIEKI